MIGRCCQSCGVFSDRSPSCRGLPQGRMHDTQTLHVQESYISPYLGESGRFSTRARDRAWSEGVGGDSCAKVLKATVVSAVLLRWLMKRPVSLERLASLVSVCFFIEKTVVAESPSAVVTATVVAAPLNIMSTLYTYCCVFCVPCVWAHRVSAANHT